MTTASELPLLRDAGFTAFQTSIQDPNALANLARAARMSTLRMLAYPDHIERSTWSRQARDWPMAAWYLIDEPDVQGKPPVEVCALADSVSSWSKSPTALVVGQGSAAARYANCPDIMMVDWYPVPHLPLDSVADHVALTRKASGNKGVWAVLQAFDWRDHPQGNSKKPRIGRFPDHKELRFMTYAAILHGATGVFYLTLQKPGGRILPDFPEEWQALVRVVQELKALQPVFEDGKPTALPFSYSAKGLDSNAWRHRLRDYVVVMNRRSDALVKFPEQLLSPEWRPLFEGRRDPRELLVPRQGVFYLEPYQVLVLERRGH